MKISQNCDVRYFHKVLGSLARKSWNIKKTDSNELRKGYVCVRDQSTDHNMQVLPGTK